jgi:hypothetical protein
MFSQNTMSCKVPTVSKTFTARSLTVSTAGFNVSASAVAATSYSFTLSDLDNTASFTGLFDQYRIDAIRFTIRPNQNAIGLFTNSTTTMVPLYCVIDYDNDNTLSTAIQARSYDNVMIIAPGESACRTFRPHVAVAAYSGTFVGFANQAMEWLDSATPTVRHYGIKLLAPQATAAQTQLQSWIIEREYYVSFRKISSGQ